MKKVLDDEIINDILDVKIYKDKKDSYIIKLGNNVLLYFIANIILRILKMNLFIANFTIPVLTIKYIGEICVNRYNKKKKLKLSKRKLSGKVNKLNIEGISIDVNDLLNARITKDNSNDENIKRIIIESNNELNILEQKASKDKYGKLYYKIYSLSEEEKEKYLEHEKDNPNIKELKTEKIIKRKQSKLYFNYFKILAIYTLLSCSYIINTIYNISSNYSTTEKILDYYDGKDSLSDEELDNILHDLETKVIEVTNDDKFKLDSVDTKEEVDNYLLLNAINDNPYANKKEKEVMYNFLDFFNDNPYLDKEKTYLNLVYLDFDRNYNPFSSGKDNNNGTVTLADYDYDDITYYTNPTEEIIAHEVTHAIFDTITIPSAYVEGFAKITESEYFTKEDDSNNSYNKNTAVTKATIELIGKDKFLEAMSNDDINIIKNALIDLNVNTWSNDIEAEKGIDDLLNTLYKGLNDNETYSDIADTLISLGSDSFTDIDRFGRLCTCTNILKVEDYNVYLPYYYFNEEKDKTLSLN